jgi:signal transduction histidine kinase
VRVDFAEQAIVNPDSNPTLQRLTPTEFRLLDRLAASLRREQRFSAELSHELRTPLTRVIAETDLALRRERTPQEYRDTLELIRRSARQLSRTIDALVAAARHEAGGARGTSDALAVANAAVEAGTGLAVQHEITVHVVPPTNPSGSASTASWPSGSCNRCSRTPAATAAASST